MAITYIEVDTAQLSADIRQLEQSIKHAETGLSALKKEMEEMNTMWKGSANAAFQAQINQDYSPMKDMLDLMKQLADSMENAEKEYQKCENEVKNAVNSIRV